jgi:DNA repair protein RadD
MPLRDYQITAIDCLFNYFNCHSGNPLEVLPTGAGKSIIIGTFIKEVVTGWANQRITMLAHRKELLEQNAKELWDIWPDAPIGVYSAGLGKRQLGRNITIAGIQSVYNKALHIGHSDLLIIDEAHLIPQTGMGQYIQFIQMQKQINPYLKVIGFTATPYRLDSGLLIEGEDRIFTDIVYEITIKELIDKGYLCPLISKTSNITADLSQVKIRGDYVKEQLESVMMDRDLVSRTVDDIMEKGKDRKSWILFCAGVNHVEQVKDELINRGISAVSVTSKTSKKDREKNINLFKERKVRAILNCDVLTTGFNASNIDLLIMLRPTKSTALYVQIVGRGTRLFPGKENCLVLDYANNIREHGPVDCIEIKKRINPFKDSITVSLEKNSAFKICPNCEIALHPRVRECADCGFIFPPEYKHEDTAAQIDIMTPERPPEWMTINDVYYSRHRKKGSPDSLKVSYYGFLPDRPDFQEVCSEWICINHTGFARDKAIQWLMKRVILDCELHEIKERVSNITIEDIINMPNLLEQPKKILVGLKGKYYEIKDCEFL